MLVPKYWYVKGLDLHGTSSDVVTEVRVVGRMERWGHRATVHHRDEPSEVYVVLEGGVELHDGAHDVATRLKPGDVYGETGNELDPRRGLVRAQDDTILAALDRETFENLTRGVLGNMEVQIGFVRRQQLAVPISMLLYTAPQHRVARVLLHFVEEYGDVDEDTGLIDFGVRTRNLARVSGLAQHTVSDIFDTMQREQVVEVGRTELVIPSLEQMRELALGDR